MKAVAVLAILSAALLAGCSAKVPTGTLATVSYAPTVDGGAKVHYEPFSGANQAAGSPADAQKCAQDQLPGQVPVQHCRGPWTTVAVNVTAPLAGDQAYTAWLVNATGSLKVADLTESNAAAKTATYSGAVNFTKDYTTSFTTLELRLGSLVVATAPTKEGPDAFALAPIASVTVGDATFNGHDLSGTVSGLPGNATFMGMLYLPDADGKAQNDAAESFAISGNGNFHYTSSSHEISDFVEFHIHVGKSKLNLYKASIQQDAKK